MRVGAGFLGAAEGDTAGASEGEGAGEEGEGELEPEPDPPELDGAAESSRLLSQEEKV